MTAREALLRSLALLDRRDKRLIGLAIGLQMSSSLLDIAGVLLIGLVGATAVTTVQSQPLPQIVQDIMDRFGLGDLSGAEVVGILAGSAAIVLLGKSLFSSYMTRRVFMFLANRQALVTARLTKALLSMPLEFIRKRSSQETAYALINGTGAATMAIIGQVVIAATEVALLLALAIALIVVDPVVAIASVLFFALTAILLQRAMGGWAARVGSVSAAADIASLNAVQEALAAYREVAVLNRRSLYVHRIQELRWMAARVAADAQFIGMLPKYLFEAALVVGGFALTAFLFATEDSVVAVGTLALFLAAATRVMPSLLRLQGAALGLRAASGTAATTFSLAEDLGNPKESAERQHDWVRVMSDVDRGHLGFIPAAELQDVTVKYADASPPILAHVSLGIKPGSFVALLGKSGSGKTTMADVLLGVLKPSSGTVLVSGLDPATTIAKFPGAIAYVPQDVVLANASVRDNVALGLPGDCISDDRVWRALERAHLAEYLKQSREGLDTLIGEGGVRLSGGQRQRLGIARALYTEPRFLILDEATSALDADTEYAITQTIAELGNGVTRVVIAHRLSTVVAADEVVYLDRGQIVATGSFQAVCQAVPALARQASLMRLTGQVDT